jgi:hypothetical protein
MRVHADRVPYLWPLLNVSPLLSRRRRNLLLTAARRPLETDVGHSVALCIYALAHGGAATTVCDAHSVFIALEY